MNKKTPRLLFVVFLIVGSLLCVNIGCESDRMSDDRYKGVNENKNDCNLDEIEAIPLFRAYDKIQPFINISIFLLTVIIVSYGLFSLGSYYSIIRLLEQARQNVKLVKKEAKKAQIELESKYNEMRNFQNEFINERIGLYNKDSAIWLNIHSLLEEIYKNKPDDPSFQKAKEHLTSLMSNIMNSTYKLQLISRDKKDQVEAAHYFYGQGKKSDTRELKKAYDTCKDDNVKKLLWQAIIKIEASDNNP